MTHEGRRNVLRQWGFECQCSLCTSSPQEIKLSDKRRDRIHEIHSTLAEGENLSGKMIARLADELVGLVDKESLWAQMVVYHEVISRAYFEVARDFENGTRHADLCEDAWIQYGGVEHENVEGVQRLRKDLERARLEHTSK